MKRPLLIVDGDNLAHRAYHSTPKTVRGTDDRPLNAIVGFFGMLARLWVDEHPRAVFVAWDTLEVKTYRHRLWPAYQSGRTFDPELLDQLKALPAICSAFGFGVGKADGYEADDVMASAMRIEVEAGGTCLLFTTDKDAYQLISDSVTVLSPRRGATAMDRIGPLEVVERLGVLPEQVPDFKALGGDPSDRIPGAKGIGAKTAASLLLRHGNLESVLDALQRPTEREQVMRFHEIVQMRSDLDVQLPSAPPDWGSGAETLRKLGAQNLADRLERMGAP
jgi:5'-3' exonuclease